MKKMHLSQSNVFMKEARVIKCRISNLHFWSSRKDCAEKRITSSWTICGQSFLSILITCWPITAIHFIFSQVKVPWEETDNEQTGLLWNTDGRWLSRYANVFMSPNFFMPCSLPDAFSLEDTQHMYYEISNRYKNYFSLESFRFDKFLKISLA